MPGGEGARARSSPRGFEPRPAPASGRGKNVISLKKDKEWQAHGKIQMKIFEIQQSQTQT
jgi:hypothetical protein